MPLIDQLNARIVRNQASDREVARLSGMTIAEYDTDVTAPDPLRDAAERMAQRLSFNAYCREYGVWGVRKEFHDWLVANHDHEGGDIRPAWDWMLLYEEFGPSARHDDGADELSDPEIMGRRF